MNKKFLIVGSVLILIGVIAGGVYLIKSNKIKSGPDIAINPEIKNNVSQVPERTDVQNDNETIEEMIQDGAVVITNNKIYNKANLDRFIKNTEINSKNRIEDSVKIVQTTREGDPIITELSYKISEETTRMGGNSTYVLKVDNTRDKFASEADRKVTTNSDIPGAVYGITEEKDGNRANIVLALYAEIDYVDESVKQYANIHVCSYLE